MKKLILSSIIAVSITGVFAESESKSTKLLNTYANIAQQSYGESLKDAKSLKLAIKSFIKIPTEKSLSNAKKSWLNSRESYGQTEIFRLSNGPIDAEDGWVADFYGSLEGQLNAWPLDENMIDYTIDANGKKTTGNIIDTIGMFTPGGESVTKIDTSKITVDIISSLNKNGGDANVATGYHAIEFLLWGQDQDYSNFIKDSISNGTMTAGQRPLSDFTTDKNANRRLDYLNVLTSKLVSDLTIINSAWNNDTNNYRSALLGASTDSPKNIKPKQALKQILSGMGVFIKSELANERIAVAVLTPSEEDEHSCFSDNTHRDIAQNYQGFKNILLGQYNNKSIGISFLDAVSSESRAEIENLMKSIEIKIESVNSEAKTKQHFDYQIQPNNPQVKLIIAMKNEMRKLGDKVVIIAKQNGISLTNDNIANAEETKL